MSQVQKDNNVSLWVEHDQRIGYRIMYAAPPLFERSHTRAKEGSLVQ